MSLLNSLLIFLTVCVIIIVHSFHLFLCIYRYHRLVTNISSYCARMSLSLSLCLSLFLLLFRAKSANKETDTIFYRPSVWLIRFKIIKRYISLISFRQIKYCLFVKLTSNRWELRYFLVVTLQVTDWSMGTICMVCNPKDRCLEYCNGKQIVY